MLRSAESRAKSEHLKIHDSRPGWMLGSAQSLAKKPALTRLSLTKLSVTKLNLTTLNVIKLCLPELNLTQIRARSYKAQPSKIES